VAGYCIKTGLIDYGEAYHVNVRGRLKGAPASAMRSSRRIRPCCTIGGFVTPAARRCGRTASFALVASITTSLRSLTRFQTRDGARFRNTGVIYVRYAQTNWHPPRRRGQLGEHDHTVRNVIELTVGGETRPIRFARRRVIRAIRLVLEADAERGAGHELVCVLRYRRYLFIAKSSQADEVKRAFYGTPTCRQENRPIASPTHRALGGSPQVDPSDLPRGANRDARRDGSSRHGGRDLLFCNGRSRATTHTAILQTHDPATARIAGVDPHDSEHHAEELTRDVG